LNKLILGSLLIAVAVFAQDTEHKVDPTWLRRSFPLPGEARTSRLSGDCPHNAIFGEDDKDGAVLRTVSRVWEVTVKSKASCAAEAYAGEEEIYFVLEGNAVLRYPEKTYAMRMNDFTYVVPRVSHTLANTSETNARILLMTFKIPKQIPLEEPAAPAKIANLADVKEETVQGHPTSVLYKLLVGPRTGKRDAIDAAYVVTSLFWMDFAPGGTNFPHHHEGAEEIYLIMDGQGEIAAGSGTDGIEGRYPAKAGDAYYFRANCTVGFYNQDKPGAKAHILAVRARIPAPDVED
jgi:mannose-6-phosphate isomerase-like protein (cupin superfamily)